MGNLPFEILMFFRRLQYLPRTVYCFRKLPRFKVGDIYLDCGWHPVVCTEVLRLVDGWRVPLDWDLAGVSLLDGTAPRSCSVRHCAPEKISYDVARHIVSLMIDSDNGLKAALAQRDAGDKRIKEIYDNSPELQRLWG